MISVTVCFVTCCKQRDSEACNCRHGRDRGCKTADMNEMRIQNYGIHTLLVNAATKANTLMAPRCQGE